MNRSPCLKMGTQLSRLLALGCLLLCQAGHAVHAATPWTPRHDNEIVETLNPSSKQGDDKAWREFRQQIRLKPDDLALNTRFAWQAIRKARQDGDPRPLGEAQGALTRWWSLPNPPREVRLLRATILQSTHHFDEALKDLAVFQQRWPQDLQATLTHASILQVQARYTEAQTLCQGMLAQSPWLARACLADIQSLTGDAAQALSTLAELNAKAPQEARRSIQLMRAELAERMGQTEMAHKLYLSLLLSDSDAYVEGAYADFLLDQGRTEEVAQRLDKAQANDALLLRLAEANTRLGRPQAKAQVAELRARFAALKQRGDRVHQREEARFTLRLLNQPQQALKLARQNWAIQKEPADARVLLEAAQAAGDSKAIASVQDFMRSNGWQDTRLQRWLGSNK